MDEMKQWQDQARAIDARVDALIESVHARGWKLAESVGIPRDMCCLHNAAIDDNMTGWCAGNPHRLKVAKRANEIVNDWSLSDLRDAITAKLYNRLVASPNKWCVSRARERRPINVHLLFSL